MDRFWDTRLLAILEMSEEKVELAIKILQTLSVAAGPLSFQAFCEALAVELDAKHPINCSSVLSDPNKLLDLCPGLISCSTIHSDGPQPERLPNLIHPSIREYLFSKRIRTRASLVGEFSMNENKANSDIAETCLTYLLQLEDSVLGNTGLGAKYKFLPYAATFWNLHVQNIECPLSPSLEYKIIELFTSGPGCFQTWLQVYDPDIEKERPVGTNLFPSPLYYASLLGHSKAVQALLQKGATFDEPRGKHRYPLLAAIESGHEAVARLLIDHGADIEVRYKNKDPALIRAAQRGYEEIVALLIAKGAKIDAQDKHGETALHCAVCYGWKRGGHKQILRLLLNAGANREFKNKFGRTPLHHAINQADEKIVQLLLEAGTDIEAKDKDVMVPLHHAASSPEPAIRCLLAKGANLEAKDSRGFTPLLEAVARNYERGVILLLRNGADIHARDQEDRTALHVASANESEHLARLLLQYGSDVRRRTRGGETALHITVKKHNEPVVRLLLEHGVEINAMDPQGRSALHLVADGGECCEEVYSERTPEEMVVDNLKIARLLLGNGADTVLRDVEGKTAMERALDKNDEAMVQILTNIRTDDLASRISPGA